MVTEGLDRPRYRRRHYFINREMQGLYVRSFLLIVVVGGLIASVLLYYLTRDTATASYSYSRLHFIPTSRVILPKMLLASILGVLVTGLGSALLTVFYSHRIAGPLYHIEKVLEGLCQGNLTLQFRIRRRDQLHRLCQDLNRLITIYHSRIKAIKHHTGECNLLIDTLKIHLTKEGNQQGLTLKELEEYILALDREFGNILNQVIDFRL